MRKNGVYLLVYAIFLFFYHTIFYFCKNYEHEIEV